MNTLGIIGGIGPETTVEYYKEIITRVRKERCIQNFPKINIISIDMEEMLSFVREKEYEKLIEFLYQAISRLESIGSDLIVLASNTPHLVYEELQKRAKVPMLSIVEATCEYIEKCGYKRALLTGTYFTMKENFYSKGIEKYGFTITIPEEDDMKLLHDVIFPELEEGIINIEKKKRYIEIVERYIKKFNIDCLILGCTELPIMIKNCDISVPIVNTTKLHINKIIQSM